MASPHDSLFRFTFGQVEHARPLLASVLTPSIAADADWTTLRLLSGSHIDKRLRAQHTDLLFSVQVRGRPVLIYVLFEHKARNDPWTALQVAGYVLGLWRSLRRQRPRPRRLPPIIPIVIHHGPRGWTAARELVELVDTEGLGATTVDELRPLLPQFRYVLVSFAGRSEEDLRGMAITLLGKLTLALMQFVRGNPRVDAIPALIRWSEIAAAVLHSPSGHEAIAALSSYLVQTTTLDPDALSIVIEQHIDREAADIMKTTAARLRAEGRAEGQATTLLQQMRRRFGPLPDEIETRVRAASAAELHLWTDRILTAPTLDAILEP